MQAPLVLQAGRAQATLVVADQDSPTLHAYDVRSGSDQPLETFSVHRAPVVAMRYIPRHDAVVSLDAKGAPACQVHATHRALRRSGFRGSGFKLKSAAAAPGAAAQCCSHTHCHLQAKT